MSPEPLVSVVVPTYQRERVLLDTIERLRAMNPSPVEILVIDQTTNHERQTSDELSRLDAKRVIRWIQHQPPSIPKAMNRGLVEAVGEVVLFVDDDVIPEIPLVDAHRRAHQQGADLVVAGRVLQPWHLKGNDVVVHDAPFTTREGAWVDEFMGGNFSVRRSSAVALGGFDENFVQAAYRFEAEFARRHLVHGGRIWYEPTATLRHLHVSRGGTRSYGSHLTTAGPGHAVGAYYFTLRTEEARRRVASCLRRLFGSVLTRHHLKHPWFVPVTVVSELRGFLLALRLHQAGPRLIGMDRG